MNIVRFLAVAALLASTACSKGTVDDSKLKELTERVEKLEKQQADFAEIAAFVKPIVDRQKAQEQAQAAREPDPDTRFSIPVAGDASDGPATAAVTIVEAFDFA
jgi:hypothetical protein